MKLSEICAVLEKYKCNSFTEKVVLGLTHDSRKVKEGYIFVAIKGYKSDGHDFISMAIEKGAIAVVAEKGVDYVINVPQIVVPNARRALSLLSEYFYGYPSSKMTIVGITGTNGKTTTSFFTKSIIESSGNKAGLIGTIYYQLGSRIIPANETTPESVDIQSHLSDMLNNNIRYAVIEASSHALSQHRLDGVHFRSAVFTNLSAEHLDYHENIKNYREEKIKLMRGLDENASAVLNADHTSSKYFAKSTVAQIVWYGIKDTSAHVRAEIINMGVNGTRFLLISPWGKEVIHLKLTGNHNVYNALAAATTGFCLGFDMEIIRKGLESLNNVPGRLEKLDYGQDFHVLIDYAHTHDALQVVLETLRGIAARRIILVFGCGGDRDKGKRAKMGHIAEKYSDLFWITNDNPRSEDPLNIIREIQRGIKRDSCYKVQLDRKVAIEEALLEAKKGDVVVIAGKGHERCQILKDKSIPFDDCEVVKQVLSGTMVSQN
ncbi:UDP-N-acetylmuramoyl-L-alanyl-D-glutamate-2,6-diaminopimelate ligase [Candidatus Kuenenia stuttgartiensis]|jgi:UDP-N-acetylmuramoyl-L-alanyl-D-glutamate--2,6-diaminopimelate ligase|uniref:UDP-N-acetylmuramoyl-L-alanyl-D-glutamate--2,6-diaminopimelate ligase n=1 Tax=Kuenenia stuttgartiensis TaxID=174633 RepID=Q1Q6D3_KUEST|nr:MULTISPECIES: UDP-N-acetylmuramoyl-L-alanyl-D-glutamate--2,6-diaminopimelate ligase [Kuenenia]MBE7548357.1 UDP-N-acetylmuramoyl-L-alanyl-D-glutamate--2,6-diaminopimelate ligase [Planctomycetia bacterium]MBZ0192399.1 UDP-N-acetylmuramoyl-L-alanyl-D-glutamate--2,6-diaminopimelate ligase [Candidatus Kuenenia stuttgartiensis]MCF6150797.1 UDP-N-acetylmuramoyl-L-alanyl-D-glutamate--2,6-diaminopimelate ligase [Candidatus Kuenenia stuttgartiensis]MCL4726318.1 UDP-N-acetylmuramoyl-L-alanyl-D-glutamat